jgi:hypothetical protein
MAGHDIIIETKIFKSNKDFIRQRSLRIAEAIAFKSGTIENPTKTIISVLPNGKESYFLKPGKETLRAKPNIHDMFPNVGSDNQSETDGYTFETMWEYLIKISIINQITFKKILVFLYRLCFLLDHQEIKRGKLRYSPSKDLSDYIDKIDFSLRDGFKDKFKTEELGLWEYLHFVDLFAWNEDVKYHVVEEKPDFKINDKNVGRVNTILILINIPLIIDGFLRTNYYDRINMKLLLSTFVEAREPKNYWEISNEQLVEYARPHLISA